jgi:hypothetical protein
MLLPTEAYLTIVIYERRIFIVQATKIILCKEQQLIFSCAVKLHQFMCLKQKPYNVGSWEVKKKSGAPSDKRKDG